MKKPPLRVHSRRLSLWQSMVKKTTEKLYADNPAFVEKLMDANDAFVEKASKMSNFPFDAPPIFEASYPETGTPLTELSSDNLSALLEEAFVQLYIRNTGGLQLSTSTVYRPYSDDPWQVWVDTTTAAYVEEAALHANTRAYNKYTPSNISTFGVIDWEIPRGTQVGIIGDWGTGMDDATYLLTNLMTNHRISALIHLGDVYYAGTTDETTHNFVNVIQSVFTSVGYNVPVFTIPGNHEYYSLGYPYFAMLPGLNSSLGSSYLQEASYFCLRIQDAGWQFLAMDTGYNDSDPLNAINPLISGPNLRSDEQKWHKDKLDNFEGTTILLSHHQLFSANAKINGSLTHDGIWHSEYRNQGLYNTFHKYFKNDIAGWIWGHEHNLAIFKNEQEGLAKGRLLGCSAYEEEASINPYTINCSDYSYLTDNNHPNGVKVSNANGYYNHAYAILTIPSNLTANGAITAEYYEFPSWGGTTPQPTNPAATLLFSESFTRPSQLPQPKVNFNDYIQLSTTINGQPHFLNGADANLHALLENYPGDLKVLPAAGNSGDVDDSNVVYLVSTSPLMNGMYLTSNGASGELYYASTPVNQSEWQLKIDNGKSGTSIRMGDSIHITSNANTNYYIGCNSSNVLTLTTSTSSRLSFVIGSGISVPVKNPLLNGQPYRLAVAYQNQWYYMSRALGFNSNLLGLGAISTHDIAASGGQGAFPATLVNYTNDGRSQFTYLGTNYSTTRALNSGDLINFETINGSGMGLATGYCMSGMGQTNPILLTTEAHGEFTVIKVNPVGSSHLGGVVLQNDLIYLESVSFPGEYLCVTEYQGKLYLGLSTTRTYCRIDYQEIY